MRRTKEDAELTRQNLLAAAENVFSKKGFAATRLSDIAQEAHVTRGAIYHHFGNKMELFLALHKERVDPYFKMLDEIFISDLLPKAKIKKMFTEFLFRAFKDLDFVKRQRFDAFRDVEFTGCEELHEFMQERGKKIYLMLIDLIQYGQKIRDIRQDISPELAAMNLLAYMKGLVSILFMEGQLDLVKNRSEELVETFIKGF